ncbi:MAG TPA: DDE-type integrase/transposase/recombinase [Methanothrix sp.]|nr:DDE-type integrase/transposase/recombinase [Methanothrix sp.]
MAKGNKGVKLTERKIKGIVRDKINDKSTKWIAGEWKVSESTVKRIWIYWIKNHELLLIKRAGRKKTVLDEYRVNLIIELHKEQNLGARRLEKIIKHKCGIHIPHNAIHKVLLDHGLSRECKNKKGRRKAWVRYEREHSMSLVHLDWHSSDFNGTEVCAILDDSSRCVLAGGEFEEATADNAIKLMREAISKYGWLIDIREVLTDRGAQFYANKRDKNGDAGSKFESFLEEVKIEHIKSRVNHPQTNGKFEKWNDTYEKNRFRFENFNNFMNWYNNVRYHESLDMDQVLQTPQEAFWERLPAICKFRSWVNATENHRENQVLEIHFGCKYPLHHVLALFSSSRTRPKFRLFMDRTEEEML